MTRTRHERDRKLLLHFLAVKRYEAIGVAGVWLHGCDPRRTLYDDRLAARAAEAALRLVLDCCDDRSRRVAG